MVQANRDIGSDDVGVVVVDELLVAMTLYQHHRPHSAPSIEQPCERLQRRMMKCKALETMLGEAGQGNIATWVIISSS